jgi:tetratricopeptide (TPR) repeat protein
MSPSREMPVAIVSLLLVAATLAFYNPIIHNQFTGFDDWSYILKNPHVQSGLAWDTVKWSFTTFQEGNWHPLTWLAHALVCQLFHLNPVGHHYTNLLLHAANVVLLFLLLRRATGSPLPSSLVAALFALHPVNVESVAWASELKNVLSTLFFLLALHAYDRYARTGARRFYIAVAVCFAFGLMAKPQIVTLPFVLLLWDYWPLGRLGGDSATDPESAAHPPASTPRSFTFLLREKLPLFVLAAADSVITVIAQRAGNAVRTVTEVSLPARIENIFVSYVRYIGKAFWPSQLAPMYPRNPLPAWQVVAAVLVLLLISALVLRWRHRPYLVFGWCWFLGTLVPMIGIIAVGDQAMADRYAYIAFIGLFVAVAWSLNDWTLNDRSLNAWTLPAWTSNAGRGAAVAAVLILGCLTYRQLAYWRDDDTLWRYTLRVTEGNYVAHNNLALMLAGAGRSEEAVAEFRMAKSLHQYPPNQILTLAFYELRVGHPTEAIEESDSALQASTDPKLQAVAWSAIGQAHLQLHHYEQAEQAYQNALRLNPENGMALVGSGILELRRGQFEAAAARFAHAAKTDPSDVNFLLLAQAQRRAGHPVEAAASDAQARKISPDPAQAQIVLGQYLSVAGLKPI